MVKKAEKQHYLNVYQIGTTIPCAPAMLRLTAVALGPNRVNSFQVFKQLHLSKIQQSRQEFADLA